MSPAEAKKEIKALKEHSKKITASPQQARDFLVRAGILDKKGEKLAVRYR
jgi:hypothetical protein